MRRKDSEPAAPVCPVAFAWRIAACASVLVAALPLAGCGSDSPPPLTGNLVDARGGHAGTFRSPDPAGDDGNDTDSNAASPANSQEAPR